MGTLDLEMSVLSNVTGLENMKDLDLNLSLALPQPPTTTDGASGKPVTVDQIHCPVLYH